MNDTTADLARFRIELLAASRKLSNRCLFQAAKWCAEAANGLALDDDERVIVDPQRAPAFVQQDVMSDNAVLAKTFFDCNEYERCAHLLKNEKSNPFSVFLRLYAKYLSGEKKKEEEHEGVLSSKDTISPNQQIAHIIRELDTLDTKNDAFLLYLYGIALRQQKNEKEAINKLIRSVSLFPYNWSAWEELLACVPSLEKFNLLTTRLPTHLVTKIFIAYGRQEFYQSDEETTEALKSLQEIMPGFSFIQVQRALICNHALDYDESERIFDEVIANDPHRLEDIDAYSNILYVMERRPKLAFLAQLANSTDKFRAETCCIIANYYSFKSDHEKAIIYYQRALILNRNCLSAWTLMGHEYVELKNTHAAIESYRRAVDANKRDYRAWYGLGQAYEVLEMHYYSLYYYQRATALKPYDPRMWQALGHSYDMLDRTEEAIKAYKRALKVSNMDPLVLLKIANLNEKIGEIENAASFMKLCLAEEANEGVSEQTCKARLWLARYEMKRGNFVHSHEFAEGVTRGSANDLDEARAIVRDMKSRMKSG